MSGAGSATVICDVDGTLAIRDGRGPFDFAKVGTDQPNHDVVRLVQIIASAGLSVVYLSGRPESCRGATETWLQLHVGVPGALFMRENGDVRSDEEVKRELLDRAVADHEEILLVIDDRDRVVRMWRDLGLTCLQVADGNF